MRYYLKIYSLFLGQYLKTLMQSKMNFFIGLLGCLLVQTGGIVFIVLVFKQIPFLNGWTMNELIFIYGFSQIPKGMDHFFTDYIWLLSSRMVTNGELDRYLLRPLPPLFQIICDRVQVDAIGELLVGCALVIMSILNRTVSITPLNGIVFVISIVMGAIIFTAVKLFFASLAFWIMNSSPILQLGYEISNFTKYPISIYPVPIRIISSFVVPFAFASFFPASYFVGDGSLIGSIGLEIIVAISSFIIAYMVFERGIKTYNSVGN